MKKWHHILTWSTVDGEISHRVDETSDAKSLRMMIELAGCTIERCRRELAAMGEEP